MGDILKVTKDEKFSADLALLCSSETKGICYIETKNLDGETNLKHKLSAKITQFMFQEETALDSFHGEIKCEDHNSMIYRFSRILHIGTGSVPLSFEQFLLRGSS